MRSISKLALLGAVAGAVVGAAIGAVRRGDASRIAARVKAEAPSAAQVLSSLATSAASSAAADARETLRAVSTRTRRGGDEPHARGASSPRTPAPQAARVPQRLEEPIYDHDEPHPVVSPVASD